uniref:Uncharacterized protein n=1 Tax=Anguilla anguilla TaxID=7936 RepID=A0A0E9X9R2_ANGAN
MLDKLIILTVPCIYEAAILSITDFTHNCAAMILFSHLEKRLAMTVHE